MRKNFLIYFLESIKKFAQASTNIIIFLPYFFSINALFKTLFHPWKNLVSTKTTPGFTFSEWGSRLLFNFISSTIGFIMRTSIISFYFILQIVLIPLLPILFLTYLFFIPFLYLEYLFDKTDEEKKLLKKQVFIKNHLLKNENLKSVENWFEEYYKQCLLKTNWWHLNNLLSIPPLARDWAVGFTPILDQYATDMASSTYLHHIKNIVGRVDEIKEITQILSKNGEANVIIVGDEGVGKHTIIDALAKNIYIGKTSSHLIYKRILKINMEKILSQYTDQKQREDFFEDLLKEATNAKNIILFIDDLEKYISSEKDKIDLSISIEKYAKTNTLQIIGVTTPFFYEKYILPNGKMNRLFNKVDVFEVKKSEALKIILQTSFAFENYHNILIPYETLVETVEKSEFYLTYIPFPEKAVDLLDNTCVYVKTNKHNVVLPEDINKVLTDKTHVPTTISNELKEKLINFESLLLSEIIQQDEAIKQLASSIRRSFLLIGKRKKPLASFLFLGPTGVGKTQTAKAVAKIFFSNPSENPTNNTNLIRFDMSNFQLKSDIPKLIGDISINQPGLMSSLIREHPYGVLLLDELEKANKDLLNIFLTMIDEGYFTDGFGKRIDCKNLVIIGTSNAASDKIFANTNEKTGDNWIIDYLVEEKHFSPEFLNRFDGIIIYKPLSSKSLLHIAKKMINQISKDIYSLHKIKIEIDDESISKIINQDYDPRFGARNLDRILRNEIEDKIAFLILDGKAKAGSIISL